MSAAFLNIRPTWRKHIKLRLIRPYAYFALIPMLTPATIHAQ